MSKIKVIVDGGKASSSPAMAQTLGPMKINIQDVLAQINEKTQSFAGVKVPVEIDVNEKTKEFSIEVGSPPTSELIKKELKIAKGSGTPDKTKAGNMAVEQLLKIAHMKKEGVFANTIQNSMKAVAGSCNSLGVLIEGKSSHEFNQALDSGAYDSIIDANNTEISAEKQTALQEALKEIQEQLNIKNAKRQKAEKKVEEKKPEAAAEETKEGEEKTDEKKVEEKKEEKK